MIRSNLVTWLKEGNRIERLWLLAEIEFKLRYYGNRLGLLWAFINPLSQIAMYFFVFEVMLDQGVENYPLYLFSGLLVWIFFLDCTSRSIILLRSKRQLYEHTDMNKLEIFLATHVSMTIGLIFNLFIFTIWSLGTGIYPTLTYLYFPLIYINVFILAFGVSLILSSLFVLFEDITQMWSIIIRFGFFLSPILYRGDLFEKLAFLNYVNPISGIIINSRSILLYGNPIDFSLFVYDIVFASVILIIGLFSIKKIGPRASEIV